MRQTLSGTWIAQPGDSEEMVFGHWSEFVPFSAELNDEAGDPFMFGGTVLDEDGHRQELDSFESVDDARTFCVEVLGIPASRIRVIEG
jgi:hypothetical protein